MSLRLITAPGIKPVSVADISAQVRFDLTAESSLIDSFIGAVTEKAENLTRRALITQTWELALEAFPCSTQVVGPWQFPCCAQFRPYNSAPILIPLAPVQSITSVQYLDTDGVQQTMDPAAYVLDTASTPARIVPAYQTTWPTAANMPGGVVVRFVAGYGLTAADVPESIKAWIKLNVASLYENRESVLVGARAQQIELSIADSLIAPYRVVNW